MDQLVMVSVDAELLNVPTAVSTVELAVSV